MLVAMTWLFVVVVGVRFQLPLLIPRYPLPAIVACLVVDGIDQSIFQAFGYDPPGYQGYDKAMDVYYLAIAYLATMRNWVSPGAFQVGQFLYFYRLVGVVAFELLQSRALLLVFPNTFEYFFIAYETVRSRWDPVSTRSHSHSRRISDRCRSQQGSTSMTARSSPPPTRALHSRRPTAPVAPASSRAI